MRIPISLICVFLFSCAENALTFDKTRREVLTQNAAAKIDILWVVDNSESMQEEQDGLGQSFRTFIDALVTTGVDFHIGVTSTDPRDAGQLHSPVGVRVISNSTPDPAATFLQNVKVGVQGSRSESAFAAASLTLGEGPNWSPHDPPSPPVVNAGFLRSDAALFIIMVSDEDDQSFGPVGYYYRLFDGYKGAGNEGRVSVSAIVGPLATATSAGGCTRLGRGQAQPGNRYAELAEHTGGIVTSICDDFNASLAALSLSAVGLRSVFSLDKHPNQNGLVPCSGSTANGGNDFMCVHVNDQYVAPSNDGHNGWYYDAEHNAIVFGTNNIPPPGAQITVKFMELSL